jgi:hypothetical protein
MLDVNALLEVAISETEYIKKGEEFLVRELFRGYEWNRIGRSERLLLGTLFLNYIRKNGEGIEPAEKTSSGQQKYRKLI